MKTEESDRLITQFMEYSKGSPHQTDEYGYTQCVDGIEIPFSINYEQHDEDRDCQQFLFKQLRFSSSWDWLMQVVEKIESLNVSWGISDDNTWLMSNDEKYPYVEISGKNAKENTYKACMVFITNYNSASK